jgi:uncharacterized protein (DUF2141 family)
MKFLMSAIALFGFASIADAADVTITVQGIRDDQGQIMVAVCDEKHFLGNDCHNARAKAQMGAVVVTIADVAPGNYAVQVYQDENGNNRLDKNFLGIPTEPIGFSRDAQGNMGPPKFADAAVPVSNEPIRLDIKLDYGDR